MDLEEIKVLDKGFVRLIRSMGDDSAIVQCARTSYGKGTKTVSEDRGLIRTLIRERHTSPLECIQFTFHIKAPIFVFRQWHRHRMWSYNEISGRYSEMADEFYVPLEEHVTKQNPINKQGGTSEYVGAPPFEDVNYQWRDMMDAEQYITRVKYEGYLKSGMRRELARINLPLSQYSEMYATVDLHNLFHFLKLRLDSHAQYEIRVYAEALLKLIEPIVPIAVEAFKDYVLDSINFSKNEIQILKELIACSFREEVIEELPKQLISSVRERKQFIEKLKLLTGEK